MHSASWEVSFELSGMLSKKNSALIDARLSRGSRKRFIRGRRRRSSPPQLVTRAIRRGGNSHRELPETWRQRLLVPNFQLPPNNFPQRPKAGPWTTGPASPPRHRRYDDNSTETRHHLHPDAGRLGAVSSIRPRPPSSRQARLWLSVGRRPRCRASARFVYPPRCLPRSSF